MSRDRNVKGGDRALNDEADSVCVCAGPIPPSPPINVFLIEHTATVSGTANIIGAPCAAISPISVSATVSSLGTTLCCDSGDPPPCVDTTCVFSEQIVEKTLGNLGGLCAQEPNLFQTYIELDNVGGDYQLFVRGLIATNIGDPPTCAGSCAIPNDNGNTYDLGSDPTGTHIYDFVGNNSGATYHFEITIS